MAGDSDITTLTRYIPVDAFISTITNDIKNLIRKYGHIDCGLRHEELCTELKKFINEKKTLELSVMDEKGKTKWNSEWSRKRNGFFSRLFEEEGFINMCYPPKKIGNSSLYQLKSKHIKFCKKRDEWKADVERNNEYNECVKYNQWVIAEIKSLTNEFLGNVKVSYLPTVKKYFRTKTQPEGYEPPDKYRNSRLDCTQYNPPQRSNPKGPAEKAPTDKLQPPMEPKNISGSQGRDGSSPTDKDRGSAKTKPEENIPPNSKLHIPDSQASSPSKIQTGDTSTFQDTVKTEARGSPVNGGGEKKESIPVQGQPPINSPQSAQAEAPPQTKSLPLSPEVTSPTPAIQSVPEATPTTVKNTTSSQTPVTSSSLTITSDSSLNSGSLLPSNLLPPTDDTKGQDRAPQSSTTSGTLATTLPNQNVPSTASADLSLSPPKAPVLTVSPAVTTANETGTSVSLSASIVTTTDTITTTSPVTVTSSTMSTIQAPIPSTEQVPSVSGSQEPPPPSPSGEPKETVPITEPQQTVIHQSTSSIGRDNEGTSVPTQQDGNKIITLSENTPQQSKDLSLLSNTSLPEGSQPDGKPSITSTKIPPLTTIVSTIIIILAAITLLFQLYKYTPFGFLLGRRRKRRKRDLRRTFVIPEESTYESPNITVHELEDSNLVGQTMENDVYTKLIKINRYKQEMQKRKKKNKKTLIEVHMEVLEESKNNEWELHKGDFLEICSRGFISEENETYRNFPNSKLTIKNIKNEKTIEDIQKQEILWNNWIENHRNILEQWKKEEWFQILKNKWRKEQQIYKERNNKLQENMLNEQETYSILSQKEIWNKWISKQATLIDLFNKEDWFKSMVYAQNKEKNNYHINEYNNTSITSKAELKNERSNHEYCRSKDIIHKLMVQIHMMVLEECIKEDIIKHKELCIDNFIEDMHNNNNYDEKRNIRQCDTDDFNVLEFEEMHTSRNK
ncbi:SICA C-terminal inner membrane domain containing protein, putative [Plasmodium ovale]|uniref:SICA C-terminal inner membrane domain containing protein, putative n=1 Tax=Plasmodium ovale TaxID=36330 RepID=A0A1C3KKB5_PLAOA|nr:SICA C-terminal inner membrane domain containing protein, putative [Plasmodium ovale]